MKKKLAVTTYILTCMLLVGCWNYREIDEVEIVLGIGIDSHIIPAKDSEKLSISQFLLTYEIVGIKSKEGQLESRVLMNEGDTFFRAIRKIIQKNGKQAYLAHMKILIISEELAKQGITEILDYTMRDAEYRPDVQVLITDGSKAEDMFSNGTQEVVSMKLNEALNNQQKIGTFESITVWNIIEKLSKKGFEPSMPLVKVEQSEDGQLIHTIDGTAVFKGDKMVGKLTGEETLYYLFIDDEINNQPLSMEYVYENKLGHISLEILSNTTEVKPITSGDKISMEIDIKCNVAINEMSNGLDILSDKDRKELEMYTEENIDKGIRDVIVRVQKEFQSDIFGFGDLIKRDKNKVWKKIEDDWEDIFPTIPIITNIDVEVKRSALSAEPIKIDEY